MVFAIHWHESAMDLHVSRIPSPPPTSLSTWSLWVFPVHQPRALVSCVQPGLVICFTLDNIHVLMLFSLNISPSPSPTESKRLNSIPLYSYHTFCLSAGKCLNCLNFFIIIDHATVNIWIQVFVPIDVSILLGVEVLGSMVTLCLTFLRNCLNVSTTTLPFYLPTNNLWIF